MAFDINNPYLKHKVMTASPQELRLMLLDGALHFVDLGREGLAGKDFEAVYDGFTQAKAIVMELMTSLNHEVDPDLCARLQSLYTYIYTLLIDASFKRDDDKAKEARERLAFERETWVMLIEQMQNEGEDAPLQMPRQQQVPPTPTSPGTPAPDGRRSISVQG